MPAPQRGRTVKDRRRGGAPGLHAAQRRTIGEGATEAARLRSLTARGMCPLKPVTREAVRQSPQVSPRGHRPTHQRAEGVLQNVRQDRSEAQPESTRSPSGEVPFASHDEGWPCQKSIPENRPRERLYRVLNYEMAN